VSFRTAGAGNATSVVRRGGVGAGGSAGAANGEVGLLPLVTGGARALVCGKGSASSSVAASGGKACGDSAGRGEDAGSAGAWAPNRGTPVAPKRSVAVQAVSQKRRGDLSVKGFAEANTLATEETVFKTASRAGTILRASILPKALQKVKGVIHSAFPRGCRAGPRTLQTQSVSVPDHVPSTTGSAIVVKPP